MVATVLGSIPAFSDSGMLGAADEAVLNKVIEKSNKKILLCPITVLFGDSSTNRQKCCAMKSPKTQKKTTGNNDKLIVLCKDELCKFLCSGVGGREED
jgi:hypothetical protein